MTPLPLSAQELRVLGLIAEGFTNAEIGLRLHLSEGTVKNRARDLCEKLSARNRAHAAALGVQLGLVAMPERVA